MSAPPKITAPTASTDLGGRASRALGWSLLNTAVSRLGTLAIGVALARLLGPQEFGAFAVATVALLGVLSFNELGVSLAIVRWREDPSRIAPTVTTISVLMSLLTFGALCLTAAPLARAMGEPDAAGVVRVMAVAVLVNGVVATPAALLQREFRQGRRMVADQVNTWLGAAVSLALALFGFGAMSLAVGRLSGSVVAAYFLLRWSPLPFRLGFDPGVARSLLRFGAPLAGASIIVFAVGYSDQIIAGSYLGATMLGFYVLAYNLSSWPVSMLSQPLRSVAPAAFARLQDDLPRMQLAYVEALKLLAAVGLPACLLLAGAAEPVVRLVYGRDWAPASTALTFLALAGAARLFFELSYDLLVILGRSRAILLMQGLWLLGLLPALIVGARVDGLRGVAAAQAAVTILLVVPAYLLVLSRAGLKTRRLLLAVWPAALVSLTVGASALLVARLVASPLLACALSGVVALLACAGLISRSRHVLSDLRVARRSAGAG